MRASVAGWLMMELYRIVIYDSYETDVLQRKSRGSCRTNIGARDSFDAADKWNLRGLPSGGTRCEQCKAHYEAEDRQGALHRFNENKISCRERERA